MIPMRRIKTKFGCLLLLVSVQMNISFVHAYTAEEVFDRFKLAYEKSVNFAADFEETTIRNTNKGIVEQNRKKYNLNRGLNVVGEDLSTGTQIGCVGEACCGTDTTWNNIQKKCEKNA